MRTETDKLVKDLKTAANDAEELIKATAGEINEKSRETRLRLKTALETARESCDALQEKAVEGVKVTDRTIRTHPYESLGIALGVGVLLGFFVGRRS
jgi:ElaB/YqjD/DUF883 family membrane-anchored ribosome-binding protein